MIYAHIFLLIAIIVCSAYAAVRLRVIRAAIMLATISIITTLILFLLGAPLAAVVELSVCAGLITVIFISVIGLTDPLNKIVITGAKLEKFKKYFAFPLLILVCAVSFYLLTSGYVNFIPALGADPVTDASKNVLWHYRHIDLAGQAFILLTGIFGVVVLFKKNKGGKK
jgi:NADH-quinone oxidoreductase subunit J